MAKLAEFISSLSDARHAALVVRFWSKVDRRGPDECWPWMASRLTAGYGQFWVLDPIDEPDAIPAALPTDVTVPARGQ